MIEKKAFKKELASALKDGGFVRKGQSWYLSSPEVIVAINLQQSDFDQKVYVNWGVSLKRLGVSEFPKENQCHIQTRLASLFHDQREIIERACLLSECTADDLGAMTELIRHQCNELSQQCLAEDRLEALILSGRFKKSLIMRVLRDALALPPD